MPTLAETPEVIGFPSKLHPTGWFQVGYSDDLEVAAVRPIRYFSTDLVLYRTESGLAVLQSAHCPHMGAHLGHGGTVCEETIICPYHSWRWGTDGVNTFVPALGTRSTTNRTLEVWQVRETNGIIWTWYDAERRPPMWEPPEEMRHKGNFLPLFPHCTFRWEKRKFQPQFVAENTVDLDHLISVHRNTLLPEKRSRAEIPPMHSDGHILYINREGDRKGEQADHPVLKVLGTNILHGPGVVIVDFPPDPERPWRKPCTLIQCTTPVDSEYSDGFTNVLVEQDATVENAGASEPVGTALKRVKEQIFQTGVDFPIWDNMVYINQGAFNPLEGQGFHRVKTWMRQFYPDLNA